MSLNSKYLIFQNKINITLVFYPCPKNANTSVKLFLAQHIGTDNQFAFIGDEIPRYKQDKLYFNKIKKNNLVNFLPTKQVFQKVNADEKICITRNPIERFRSAYSNRIIYHRDKDFNNHSVDEVVEKLENKLFENKHFLPQTYFLGDSLDYYTLAVSIDNLKKLVIKINSFFDKNLIFPKLQTGGNKAKIDLSITQIDKLKKIYAKDFDLLKI